MTVAKLLSYPVRLIMTEPTPWFATHGGSTNQMFDDQPFFLQVNLHCSITLGWIELVAESIAARDRYQLRFKALAENPGFDIPLDPCQGAAAQGPVNVDIAISHYIGAIAHRAQDYQIAVRRVDFLARTHRMIDDAGPWRPWGGQLGFFWRRR